MRILSRNTLVEYWKKHANAEQPLKTWFEKANKTDWENHNELKKQFGDASIVAEKGLCLI